MAFSTHNKSVHQAAEESGYVRKGVGARHRFQTAPAKPKAAKKSAPADPGQNPGGDTDDYAAGTVVKGLDAGARGSGFGAAGIEPMTNTVHQMGDPDEGDTGDSMGGLDRPEMSLGGPVHLHLHLSPAEHKGMKAMNARKRK